ncbi:hypothetical protein [Planctomycetes bacterium K23_9]|uniref:Sulfatase n=1 Tax=Stieleria marina TaxID=1930275 RepID=A0A517NMD1_9BACT|nr:hypothetical protein K239x_02250 [Planctomycetes bacterium K23_9]
MVSWSGKIPGGVVNDEVMTEMHLLPTIPKLAGAEVPSDRVIDGKGLPKPALYDLKSDISEKHDMLADHPNVVASLRASIETSQNQLAENSRPAAFVDDPKPLQLAN